MTDIIVSCPHCNKYIAIKEINCAIFRHGNMKNTFSQINPHSSKKECNDLIEKKLIYGCGNPFRLTKNSKDEFIAIICDYI
jgi:hypothetical protein